MNTISVIVPVYNVAPYLDKAVSSVCDQTYTDWEMILIDDGSTDASPAICDTWVEKDSRIRVIHKENGGVSTARNAGLDAARGAYIYFLDPDDYLHPETFAELFALIREYHAQIALGFTRGTHARDYAEPDRDHYRVQTASGKQALEYLYMDPDASMRFFGFNPTTVLSKLYDRAVFQSIRFDPDAKMAEDLTIIPYLLDSATTIVSTDRRLYYVYHRPGSLTRDALSSDKAANLSRTVCRMYGQRLAYFRDKRADGYEELLCATYRTAFNDLIEKRETFKAVRDCRKILRKGLHAVLRGMIRDRAAPPVRLLRNAVFVYMPFTYSLVYARSKK